MGAITIGFGAVLIILGAAAYLGSGRASFTALIPAFFGLALLLCGVAAKRWPQVAIIAAMVVAALGLLGILGRIVPALVGGGEEGFTLNLATGVQIVMAILMGVFLALAVRWAMGAKKGSEPRPAA